MVTRNKDESGDELGVCLVADCTTLTAHVSGLCRKHRTHTCVICESVFSLEGYAILSGPRTRLCSQCIRIKRNLEIAKKRGSGRV